MCVLTAIAEVRSTKEELVSILKKLHIKFEADEIPRPFDLRDAKECIHSALDTYTMTERDKAPQYPIMNDMMTAIFANRKAYPKTLQSQLKIGEAMAHFPFSNTTR